MSRLHRETLKTLSGGALGGVAATTIEFQGTGVPFVDEFVLYGIAILSFAAAEILFGVPEWEKTIRNLKTETNKETSEGQPIESKKDRNWGYT